MGNMLRLIGCVWLFGGVPLAVAAGDTEVEFFEKQVRPLLVRHCYECHSQQSDPARGGLLLDSRSGWQRGGDSGEVLVPGDPAASLLLEAVRYEGLEMPPAGRLTEREIGILAKWIAMGAPDPRTNVAGSNAPADSALQQSTISAADHWAFRPVGAQAVPPVRDAAWPSSEIDCFVLSQLESRGLAPVDDAEPAVLFRRLCFDLIGLPPTPAELADFLADPSPAALERAVDRLLASHHFGETWGRHWLDVARYADTNGLDENFTFYDAWRYRNYVVDAWNKDKPFDRFIWEQVAGDLLPFACQAERDENLTATGFLVLGPKVIGATDKQQLEMDVIDEQIDTVGKALLGMTLGCARCHDHKFDPIPTRDYYALAGIFASTETLHGNLLNRKDLSGWNLHPLGPGGEAAYGEFLAHEKSLLELQSEQSTLKGQKKELEKELARIAAQRPGRPVAQDAAGDSQTSATHSEPRSPEGELAKLAAQLEQLERQLAELKENPPLCPPLAMSVNDQPDPGPTRIRVRGLADRPGELVPRGFVSAVEPAAPAIDAAASGRRELAGWLTDARNPLPSRVAVNRIWHHLFGAGLVRTVDNFGRQGEAPSHPELLDYLAAKFVEDGWSPKRLIRRIVLSRVYRLSTRHAEPSFAVDPENRLLWRMNRRRLTVEALRDGMLAISGQLDRSPAESVVADLKFQATGVGIKPREPFVSSRRTVYLPVVRNDLPAIFQVFDFVDPQTVSGRRSQTTVSTQSLFMMNSRQAIDAAERAARQLVAAEVDDRTRVETAFRQILARSPEQGEIAASLSLLADLSGSSDGTTAISQQAWSVFCQALFSSTRFQYLD